jgi:hypothetical protein
MQVADPDIPVTDRVAVVVLQLDAHLRIMLEIK